MSPRPAGEDRRKKEKERDREREEKFFIFLFCFCFCEFTFPRERDRVCSVAEERDRSILYTVFCFVLHSGVGVSMNGLKNKEKKRKN